MTSYFKLVFFQRHLSCYRGYPELNSGKTINKIRDPDSSLLCPGDPNGPTHALLTILILLAMMLLVVALVYLNRERIRKVRFFSLLEKACNHLSGPVLNASQN